MVGDWIVYLEPRKVAGTRGYFAVAKVRQIIPDPGAPGMYIAVIDRAVISISQSVPFSDADGLIERGLAKRGRRDLRPGASGGSATVGGWISTASSTSALAGTTRCCRAMPSRRGFGRAG